MIRGLRAPGCYSIPSQTENLPERPFESIFGDNPYGWALGVDGTDSYGKRGPFRALVATPTADERLMLREAVGGWCCRGGSTWARLSKPRWSTGTSRGARAAARGAGGTGPPRPGSRGGTSAPAAGGSPPHGPILEHRRKLLATWVSFVRLMRHNVPVECATEPCVVTHKTAFEWRHRVLATVAGHQDRIVLRDTVWVDETYVNDIDLSKGYGQARKRGLPRQKLCICVAIDIHKNPVAVVCGHGKRSSARIRKAMGGRIAPRSLLIHDLERAHGALVSECSLGSEAHRADVNDPVYLERMEMVNDLCSWLKRYLWRFTGMSHRNLQAYLDWHVCLFRVNQARDRWDPTARVLRHILMADATYLILGWLRYHPLSELLDFPFNIAL